MKQAAPLVRMPLESSFSAAEFAAGFDLPPASALPAGWRHDAHGARQKLVIADVYHDRALARQAACSFTRSLADIVGVLEKSPLARALLLRAVTDGATAGTDPFLSSSQSFYYADCAHIDLGRQEDTVQACEKTRALSMAGFVAGLRRHWQESHGFAPALTLCPRDYADHARLLAADSAAVLHLVAWELRAQGHAYLWRSLIADSLADVAAVFEDAVRADAQAQFSGSALKAAFNQWFAVRERGIACDAQSLEMYDCALVRLQGRAACRTVATQALQRAELQQMGLLPDGINYLAGCVFTSAWYDGFDDPALCQRLDHVQEEIKQSFVFNS